MKQLLKMSLVRKDDIDDYLNSLKHIPNPDCKECTNRIKEKAEDGDLFLVTMFFRAKVEAIKDAEGNLVNKKVVVIEVIDEEENCDACNV